MEEFKFDIFCRTCTKEKAYKEANCICHAHIKQFKAGEKIVYRGEAATSILMVSAGRIANETILDSGISLISIEHSAPYPLGAVALFAQENHFRIDSTALEDCTVGVISRERIEEQIMRCKIFMRNFIADNATKVDILSQHLSILSHKGIKAKVAAYIFTKSRDRIFSFDRSVTELATYFCVERPSLSRTIKELAQDGIISYHRGRGEIIESEALKNLLG